MTQFKIYAFRSTEKHRAPVNMVCSALNTPDMPTCPVKQHGTQGGGICVVRHNTKTEWPANEGATGALFHAEQ